MEDLHTPQRKCRPCDKSITQTNSYQTESPSLFPYCSVTAAPIHNYIKRAVTTTKEKINILAVKNARPLDLQLIHPHFHHFLLFLSTAHSISPTVFSYCLSFSQALFLLSH